MKLQSEYSAFRASANSFFSNAHVNVKGGAVNDNMVNILQCSTAASEDFTIRNYPAGNLSVADLPPNFQTACKAEVHVGSKPRRGLCAGAYTPLYM